MKFIHQLDQPNVKKHILLASSGFILGVLLYFYFKTQTPINTIEVLLSAVFGMLVGYACYTLSKQLDKLVPWKDQMASRFLTGILILYFVSLALVLGGVFLYSKIDSDIAFNTTSNYSIKLGIMIFILILLYNIIYLALYSYHTYATGQIDKITYDRKQIDLQLKALKSQLSSHFLFNNLNTISALAHKDPKASETYIRGLSTIYNYTLNSYNTPLVTLEEELHVALSYLKLHKTRYGESLKYTVSIPETIKTTKIPPLTLQMLLENAIKHNQMDSNHVLNLDIIAHNNYIEVRNNITKAPAHVKSFHIGLKNIEARYQLLYNQTITIIRDSHFIVKIPIILT